MAGNPQAAALGFQRVSWVRILLGPGGPRCEVMGSLHRRPTMRTVPLRTATALMAQGVPGVVRRVESGTAVDPPARPPVRVSG